MTKSNPTPHNHIHKRETIPAVQFVSAANILLLFLQTYAAVDVDGDNGNREIDLARRIIVVSSWMSVGG